MNTVATVPRAWEQVVEAVEKILHQVTRGRQLRWPSWCGIGRGPEHPGAIALPHQCVLAEVPLNRAEGLQPLNSQHHFIRPQGEVVPVDVEAFAVDGDA
jgi:hypothetical protein